MQQLIEKLQENKIKYKINEDMKKYTTFKIGGLAEYLIIVENSNQLKNVLVIAKEMNVPITVIGNGSNILIKDKGIKGITLKIEIKKIEIKENNNDIQVRLGAGNKLIEIATKLSNQGYTGLEFATGIPGTIGGAIKMNAGAHGCEMKDIVQETTYMDLEGNIKIISNQEHKFEYRKSIFASKKYIILETVIKLQKGNQNEINEKIEEYKKYRRDKQPIDKPSAGSTFKRLPNCITAKLIDECGLKGKKIGGAEISTKHAGFIINVGDATAKDVLDLIKFTKEQVYEKTGENIETEIEIIGE